MSVPSGATRVNANDTNEVWYVNAYASDKADSTNGPCCFAVPKLDWDACPAKKKAKITKYFGDIDSKKGKATRARAQAVLNSMPNDIRCHIWFCQDEGLSRAASFSAGNGDRPPLINAVTEE